MAAKRRDRVGGSGDVDSRHQHRQAGRDGVSADVRTNGLAEGTLMVPLDVRDSGPLGQYPSEKLVLTRDEPPTHNLQQKELRPEVFCSRSNGPLSRTRMRATVPASGCAQAPCGRCPYDGVIWRL